MTFLTPISNYTQIFHISVKMLLFEKFGKCFKEHSIKETQNITNHAVTHVH